MNTVSIMTMRRQYVRFPLKCIMSFIVMEVKTLCHPAPGFGLQKGMNVLMRKTEEVMLMRLLNLKQPIPGNLRDHR